MKTRLRWMVIGAALMYGSLWAWNYYVMRERERAVAAFFDKLVPESQRFSE